MSFQVSRSDSGRFVVCVVKEPVTAEFARVFGQASVEVARAHHLNRYLYDVRSAPNIESVQGNYDFAYSDMAELGIDQRSRTAILVTPGDRSHDFVEIVTKNAGYNVRVFSDEAEAVAWLDEDLPNS